MRRVEPEDTRRRQLIEATVETMAEEGFSATTLASIGLPTLNNFVGEFLVLQGAAISHFGWAVFASLGVILSACYMLWMYQRVFTGVPEGDNATLVDATPRELVVVVPLLALSLFIGLYSKPVIDRVEPTVKCVMAHFEHKGAPLPERVDASKVKGCRP